MYKIALIKDINTGWWKRFVDILTQKNISYKLIDIENDDWLEQIGDIQHVIWRPNLSEPFLQQAKEKIYFLEVEMGLKVYPNMKTFWHYDNKNAEKYLANIKGIKFPNTFVSYSYDDCMNYLQKTEYPIISKSFGGAGSINVRKLNNQKEAIKELKYLFNKGLYNRIINKIYKEIGIRKTLFGMQKYYVHYQQFIKDNKRDLRISTIGDKYVFAFYRNNRKNDFRASGSGDINYNVEQQDLNTIKHFLQISKKNDFDSMCYDILYNKKREFFVGEFSYIFVDTAIYNCPGYYEIKNDELVLTKRNTWPQELIIEYLTNKWNIKNR